MYVCAKDMSANTVIVCSGREHPALFTTRLEALSVSWLCEPEVNFLPVIDIINAPLEFRDTIERTGATNWQILRCEARHRNRQPLMACSIIRNILHPEHLFIFFIEPQWAVTPGQVIVFFWNEMCLGSAVIRRPGPSLYKKDS
jgi:tRNA-specific 2-thiouridylase